MDTLIQLFKIIGGVATGVIIIGIVSFLINNKDDDGPPAFG